MPRVQELRLHGARVVDAGSGEVSEAVTVTVHDGRIADVGPWTERSGPGIDVDLDGRYVTAGLVDMHVHLCHEPRAHRGIAFSHDEPELLAICRVTQNLAEMQQHGICLVRDVGGRDGPIRAVAALAGARRLALPDVESAGVPFCVESGHGAEFGRVVDMEAAHEDTMAAHAALGHSWIKVMNGPEIWPQASLTRLCEAAHRAGLKVAVHAFTDEGVWSALVAGADTIEHSFASSEQMADAAAAGATTFVPTAFAAQTSLASSFASTMPDGEIVHLETWRTYLDDGVAMHRERRLPALAGTDAGCAPCQAQDIVEELVALERWGFESSDVVWWATGAAARVLDREQDYGSVAPGRWASLLVTDESPLETVAHLRDPLLVLAKGTAVRDRLGVNLA